MSTSKFTDVISTYNDLRWWCNKFFDSEGPTFLIIVGSPGISKSTTFANAAPTGSLILSGALSAFHLYMELHRYRDKPVVIDDVDALFTDKASVNLLKCLGNTDRERTLYWGKQAKQLVDEGIPHRFKTSSRVCILANTIATVERNLEAVLDRAFVLNFTPSVREVHHEVGKWFRDSDVYSFYERHLPLVTAASMRTYVKATEMKRMGADWQKWLLNQWLAGDPQLALVAQILTDASLTTAADRARRFRERGGGARATFMRHQGQYRRLMAEGEMPEK